MVHAREKTLSNIRLYFVLLAIVVMVVGVILSFQSPAERLFPSILMVLFLSMLVGWLPAVLISLYFEVGEWVEPFVTSQQNQEESGAIRHD